MATLKYAKVLIIRNPMEKIAKTVGLHELPVLEAVHGKSNVQVLDDHVSSQVPVPDVEQEFERLKAVYGDHPKTGVPFVEGVYGAPLGGGFARALESASETQPTPDPAAETAVPDVEQDEHAE